MAPSCSQDKVLAPRDRCWKLLCSSPTPPPLVRCRLSKILLLGLCLACAWQFLSIYTLGATCALNMLQPKHIRKIKIQKEGSLTKQTFPCNKKERETQAVSKVSASSVDEVSPAFPTAELRPGSPPPCRERGLETAAGRRPLGLAAHTELRPSGGGPHRDRHATHTQGRACSVLTASWPETWSCHRVSPHLPLNPLHTQLRARGRGTYLALLHAGSQPLPSALLARFTAPAQPSLLPHPARGPWPKLSCSAGPLLQLISNGLAPRPSCSARLQPCTRGSHLHQSRLPAALLHIHKCSCFQENSHCS